MTQCDCKYLTQSPEETLIFLLNIHRSIKWNECVKELQNEGFCYFHASQVINVVEKAAMVRNKEISYQRTIAFHEDKYFIVALDFFEAQTQIYENRMEFKKTLISYTIVTTIGLITLLLFSQIGVIAFNIALVLFICLVIYQCFSLIKQKWKNGKMEKWKNGK